MKEREKHKYVYKGDVLKRRWILINRNTSGGGAEVGDGWEADWRSWQARG